MNDQILLIVLCPPEKKAHGHFFEHLGIAHIAAYLRQHDYLVDIIDQNITHESMEELLDQVKTIKPQLIGISCYQEAYTHLQYFVHKAKEILPKTHISLGGVFATNSFQYILNEIKELDSIILGDGEETFLHLADAVYNHQNWTSIDHLTYPNDPIQDQKSPKYDTDLSKLPNPSRDTLPAVINNGLYPTMIGSRGCYGNCTYCSITIQNRRRRCREVTAIIDEMEELYTNFDQNYVYMVDDTFIGRSRKDHHRIEQFAHELIKRNKDLHFSFECRANEVDPDLMRLLKEAGLSSVFMGIESGYQPTLDLFQKGITVKENLQALNTLRELGISFTIGFIMFHPYTTFEEIKANLNFLFQTEQKNMLDSIHRKLLIFHNSRIAEDLKSKGLLTGTWHNCSAPFLNEGITELCNYTERFATEIKPFVNRLAASYSHSNDSALKSHMAKVHSELCSNYVQTIFDYLDNPKKELLHTKISYLLNLYKSESKNFEL